MSKSNQFEPFSAARFQRNQEKAKQLLAAYHEGDQTTINIFRKLVKGAKQDGYSPSVQEARAIVSRQSTHVPKLHLGKLKKDAKDLLKNLKVRESQACLLLQDYHPKAEHVDAENCQLSDAQLILARTLGLPSWPALKAHVEAMTDAEHQLAMVKKSAEDFSEIHNPDGDCPTLHIRCGSDLKAALPTCGFSGDFLEVINPFPQGPVPPSEPLDNFVKIREHFTQSHFAVYFSESAEKNLSTFRAEELALRNLPGKYQRIVLWVEHDAFDQLCFAYILHHLVKLDLGNVQLELVQIDRFPGVERFIGLGQLTVQPAAIRLLWQKRSRVSAKMIHFGYQVWQAFTNASPMNLWKLQSQKHSPLPMMQHAMKRMLQELPWVNNGLSLTEQLILSILQQDSPIPRHRLFLFLSSEADPQPFLGDIMCFIILDGLAQGPQAAIKQMDSGNEHPSYELTEIGRELLNEKGNWMNLSPKERWVGGVRVQAKAKNWCWNPVTNQPQYMVSS